MPWIWKLNFALWLGHVAVHGQNKPNFIIVLADDLGYGDLQCYGHHSQEGGPIDIMAKEGMRFVNWYSAASASTPSRASLLTGRLPVRTGMYGQNRSLSQLDSGGLPASETTIAEALKKLGYTTGMAGKWHLGINQNEADDGVHLPSNHGFDEVKTNYPLSQLWECNPERFDIDDMKEHCFKYQNKEIVQQPVSFDKTTSELVEDVKTFIKQHSDTPFFFYMSMLQTHSALFCSKEFCGKSKRGPYGDSINEMSWAVGEVLSTLKEEQIDDNTLVLFLSDNGPSLEMCSEGGQTGFFAGGKYSTWDGGLRVPAIARWPGKIPEGAVNNEAVSTLDIYSTLLEFAGSPPGADEILDGESIVGIMTNDEKSPHDYLFHYCSDRLMAVQYGDLKFHFYTQDNVLDREVLCNRGKPKGDTNIYADCYGENVTAHDPPEIYHIGRDVEEMFPLDSQKYTEELNMVKTAVQTHSSSITGVKAQIGMQYPSLQPCCNPPTCVCNYPNGVPPATKTKLVIILPALTILTILSIF